MCEPLLCCAVWSFLLCCRVKSYSTVLCSAFLCSALLCSALLCSVESFAEVFFWLALCFAALCCCVVLWTVLCRIMLRCRLLSKASSLKNLWVSSQPQLFSSVFIKTPSPSRCRKCSHPARKENGLSENFPAASILQSTCQVNLQFCLKKIQTNVASCSKWEVGFSFLIWTNPTIRT